MSFENLVIRIEASKPSDAELVKEVERAVGTSPRIEACFASESTQWKVSGITLDAQSQDVLDGDKLPDDAYAALIEGEENNGGWLWRIGVSEGSMEVPPEGKTIIRRPVQGGIAWMGVAKVRYFRWS